MPASRSVEQLQKVSTLFNTTGLYPTNSTKFRNSFRSSPPGALVLSEKIITIVKSRNTFRRWPLGTARSRGQLAATGWPMSSAIFPHYLCSDPLLHHSLISPISLNPYLVPSKYPMNPGVYLRVLYTTEGSSNRSKR